MMHVPSVVENDSLEFAEEREYGDPQGTKRNKFSGMREAALIKQSMVANCHPGRPQIMLSRTLAMCYGMNMKKIDAIHVRFQ